MEIKPPWIWVSAKRYSKLTGMGYETVLKLCRAGKLPCVETGGGEKHCQFRVQYNFNNELLKKL